MKQKAVRMTAQQLREARERLNLSQEAFAMLLGYKDKSSISRLESGDRPINPRQQLLVEQALVKVKSFASIMKGIRK